MSFTTCFYAYNNSYALKVATVKIAVAANWLRQRGCVFTTYSDRKTGLTKFYLKHCPEMVVKALIAKYGFFNAQKKATTQAASTPPVAPTPRPLGKSEITREEWLSRFGTKAVAQPKARKIRNANELSSDATVLQPIPVVVPQLCVEEKLYNKEMVNGVWVVTGTYTCQTVQKDGDGFHRAVTILNCAPQTNSELSGGVAHITETVAGVEVSLMPGCATAEQLMSCTLNQLYKFASTHNIKGRSSLKGEKNKAALVEKLLGLVKKSSI